MTFDEKIKILRNLPQFKVIPISELRAIAFAAKEINKPKSDLHILYKSLTFLLALTPEDIEKITREYPDLEAKLR